MVNFNFHLTPQARENARRAAEAAATNGHHPTAPLPPYTPPKYTVSDAFRMFARRTNGHGWIRTSRARSFWATNCWFILTLIVFIAAIVYTALLWANYAQYETETSIHSMVGKLPFPSVTVCSNNPIKVSSIVNAQPDSYRQSLQKIPANIDSLFKEQDYYIGKLKTGELDPVYDAYVNLVAARNGSTVEQRYAIGCSVNELVLSCKFGGKVCDFAKESQRFYDDVYGNCYTWNYDSSERMVAAGIDNGLQLVLMVSVNDSLPYYVESQGAKVVVHEPGTMPLPATEAKSVAAGLDTELGLSLSSFSRLGHPYNDPGCMLDYDDFTNLFGFDYTMKGCFETCQQRATVRQCGCSDSRKTPAAAPICDASDPDVIACLAKVSYSLQRDADTLCKCPPACSENVYESLNSYSNWPSETLKSTFKSKYGVEYNNTARVQIYYRTPVTTKYADQPSQTRNQFIGWLGGQLFVWSGTSLITLLEVVAFLLTSVLVICTQNVDWLMVDHDDLEYPY
uniref:Uncharacterized protein n=1 Tax=Plectus sambesii TaxID=2011161 RepID=A0A914VQF6_9BILA